MLALGFLGLLAVAANRRAASLGGHDLSPLIRPSILIIAIGVGLLLHHKWAAAIFTIIWSGVAIYLAIGSIMKVPFPWVLLNLVGALFLMVPAIIAVRRWSELK